MTALCYTLLGQSAYVDDLSLTSHHTLSFPIFPTRAIMTPWIQEFEALQATSLSCLAVMMSSMWRVTGCHVALWRRSVADLATCLTVCLPACLPVCLLTWLPACLSASLSLSTCLSDCLSFCLPLCLPLCLSTCLSACLRTYLPACLSFE